MCPTPIFLLVFIRQNSFQPVAEKVAVRPFVDVFEHVAVGLVILLFVLLVRMHQGHDGVGVALEPAYFALALLLEADVGDEVEVGRNAQPLVRPHVEVEPVVPIGGVELLHAVEAPDPVAPLPLLAHVGRDDAGEVLAVVGVHGEREVLPAVAPRGPSPSCHVGSEIGGEVPLRLPRGGCYP